MSLLVILALAMVTLSKFETKKVKDSSSLHIARSNARIALMMALGELQKSLGPDQRISASSSILDEDPSTTDIDGVAHKNLLMVYDSWDTHLHAKKFLRDDNGKPTNSTISITDTYDTIGRHEKLFRRYLVSHEDTDTLKNLEAAIDSSIFNMDESNSVALVRPLSTSDPEYDASQDLRAGLIQVTTTSEKPSGSIAWAVVGRNLPSVSTYENESKLSGLAAESNEADSPRHYDVSTYEGASDIPDDPELYHKNLSLNELDINTTQSTGRRHFFKLTGGGSYSLLSNVRNSGLKKDLNLFLESDWGDFSSNNVHGKYKSATLSGATVEVPLCGIEAADAFAPSNPNIPPTSWRQLRDYYRLYRNDLNYAPGSVQWGGSSPSIDYLVSGDYMNPGWGNHHSQFKIPDTLGYHRSPVTARIIYLMGLSSKQDPADEDKLKLYMHVSPVVVLWNPFNVSLRVNEIPAVPPALPPFSDYSIQAAFDRAFSVEYLVRSTSPTGSTGVNVWREPAQDQGGVDNAGNHWDDIALTNGSNTGSNDVIFQPGEVRIFSMQKPVGAAGKIHLSPGFNNNVLFDETLKQELATIPKASLSATSFSLRFKKTIKKGLWGPPEVPLAYGSDTTAFGFESYGRIITSDGEAKKSLSITGSRGAKGGVIMDWFTRKGAQIVKNTPEESAKFPSPAAQPTSVALFGMSLKGVEEYDDPNTNLESAKPVANRTWLHANPTQHWRHLFKPNELKRTSFPYEIIYGTAVGNGVTEHLQSEGNNAFIGPSNGAAGVKHFTYQEIPVSPITSLAGFSGMRLTHGRPVSTSYETTTGLTFGPNTQHIAHWGAAFGCGVGNSFAHPMISGNQVYEKHSGFTNGNGSPVFEDHYDTLLLANDALYDDWFCSSIAPQTSPAYDLAKETNTVIDEFIDGSSELPNQRLKLHTAELNRSDIAAKFKGDDAYKTIASYLLLNAGFNINNPHPESWKALLHGLKKRQIPYIDATTGSRGISAPNQGLALSRFNLANSDLEGNDESDPASWTGIRYLTDPQIDKLAEEIAKQVKYRGPFLNMSEFVNRRLTEDRLGICGPLQAAIDHDDFDNNYSGDAGSGFTINGQFKSDTVDPANDPGYPFPLAARGSHYTGIPGYVMQADLLKAMGGTLTVRDDTFVIRAYGDARDSRGKIISRAWCEATIQRMPEYLAPDATDNSAEKPAYTSKVGNQPTRTALSDINRKYGRKFSIVSFRWLAPNEVN